MSEYYYNSVKLPILPEWNKSVYPKVIIYYRQATLTSPILTCLLCYSAVEDPEGYRDADNREYFAINFPALYSVYDENTNSWGTLEHSDDAYPEYTGISISMGELIWSNHDIVLDYTLFGENYSDQFLASDPVPVTVPNPFCLRSWLTGFALGLAGTAYPYSAPTPTAYLYNGIRLPALPEWDKGVYPYAVIHLQANGLGYAYMSTEPLYFKKSNLLYYLYAKSECSVIAYYINTVDNPDMDYWSREESKDAVLEMDGYINSGSTYYRAWANYDVLKYDDNTLWLAASDPVPVYE